MKFAAVFGSVGAVVLLSGCGSQAVGTPTPSPSSLTPVPSTSAGHPPGASSVLVFSRYDGTGASSVTSFVAPDGSVIKTLTSSRSDGTFIGGAVSTTGYIGYSSALLSSNQLMSPGSAVSVTRWAVSSKSGIAQTVAASLTPYLNHTWQTGGATVETHGIFVTGDDRMFAAVFNVSGINDYDEVDLLSGRVTTLFTERDGSHAQTLFAPENITPDGTRISFLVENATIDGQTVDGLAVAEYDVVARTLTVHGLTQTIARAIDAKPGVSAYSLSAFASADGSLLVYQTTSVSGGNQAFTTHIYHVATGDDVTLPASTALGFGGGDTSVLFSADGASVALAGSGVSGNRLEVVSAASGAVVTTIDSGAIGATRITLEGWTSSGALVVVTVPANAANPSEQDEITHLLDPATGSDRVYPAGLGQLDAVLY